MIICQISGSATIVVCVYQCLDRDLVAFLWREGEGPFFVIFNCPTDSQFLCLSFVFVNEVTLAACQLCWVQITLGRKLHSYLFRYDERSGIYQSCCCSYCDIFLTFSFISFQVNKAQKTLLSLVMSISEP